MSRFFFLPLLAFFCLAVSGEQPVAPAVDTVSLDRYFDVLEQQQLMMGSVTVAVNGKPVYNRQLGFRDSTSSSVRKAENDTKYRIGSISKVFTATIVLQLIEEGKLGYDTPLSDFYPQLSYAKRVTIGQMLRHHSGLPHFHLNSELDQLWNAKNETEVIRLAGAQPFVPQDVKNGAYSNLNFILLGFIIEKVTGTPYEEQLQQRIASPLGLTDTYFLRDRSSASKNEAHAYDFYGGRWQRAGEPQWNFTEASGGLVSTTDDLSRFISGLFTGKLLKAESLEQMKTLQHGFGLGIEEAPFYDQEGFGHTGRIGGFLSELVYYPDKRLSVALTINGHVYPMNDIVVAVLSIVNGKPYAQPSLAAAHVNDAQLDALAGRYFAPDLGEDVTVTEKQGALEVRVGGNLLEGETHFTPVSASRFYQRKQGAVLDFDFDARGEVRGGMLTVWGAGIGLVRR